MSLDTEAVVTSAANEPFAVMAKPTGPICNLGCDYCYYLEKTELFGSQERFRASESVIETYIRTNIESSVGPYVQFSWHGGEPTLAGIDFYRRIVALQQRYLPAGWSALNNIQTNGTLLNDRWAEFLAANQFTVGISIDGPAYLHDSLRRDKSGCGSHVRVMRGLHVLRAHGIEPDVLCTVNSATVQHPLAIYRFFREQNVSWLQFLPVVRRAADGGADALSVDPEALGDFLCTIFDEWIRHDVGRVGVQNFLESLLVWSGQEAHLCVMAETCGRVLAMEHDGSVYSCDHFVDEQHRLGRVDDGLAALLESPSQRAFGTFKRDGLPSICRECPVRFVCNGGCPKDRFAVAPNGEDGLNYLCGGYRRFYEHIDSYMRRMVALAARRLPITQIMAQVAALDNGEPVIWPDVGRNDPCGCGSGRKYKHCCLRGASSAPGSS
ncbi:anaerobic sulfatase maturase [Ferrimicrobium acidiphilum]|uniref:Anaerobic sulfatase-maturating enzyme n=1 Tax=Ferrimicrobium acidiphilum DSM 19497 TaxID=1121877 RepID=A0A0D8FSG2_9ACTN|nr:anaerobic sulfatase maturase [Ferrimicrobium acidiphilum]KJE76081.1 anaerobic sulfatase-maturating enzyme [Ferrimicrobium acidiphilum DSM 19497]